MEFRVVVVTLLLAAVPTLATLSCSMMMAAQQGPFAEKLVNMVNNGEYPRDPDGPDAFDSGTKEPIVSFAPKFGYEMGGTSERQKERLTNPNKWGLKKDWGPPPRGKKKKGTKTGTLLKRANNLLYKVAKWNLKGLSLEKERAIKALCRKKAKGKKKKKKKKKGKKGKEGKMLKKAKKMAKKAMKKKKGKKAPGPKMAKRISYKTGGKSWKGTCKKGRQQSPININTKSAKKHKGKKKLLKFSLKNGPAKALHDNNRIVVGGLQASVTYKKKKYSLKHVSFHSPGEHTINGKKASVEMQLRFGKGKEILMVSVLMKAKSSKKSKFLKHIRWNKAPKHPKNKQKIKSFKIKDLTGILKGDYYTYYGSLTTPPCTEGVKWFVMKKIHLISKKQRKVIYKMFRGDAKFARGRGNNRAIMGLRGRKVRLNGAPIKKKGKKKKRKKKKASKKKKRQR